jgi:hypothetical protein
MGSVTFVQRFGSALQLNVHFHLLAPEGVFTAAGAFVPLPPPDDEDVRALLEASLHRLQALLDRWDLKALGALPQDALEALYLSSARARPPGPDDAAPGEDSNPSSVSGLTLLGRMCPQCDPPAGNGTVRDGTRRDDEPEGDQGDSG